jgi:hypothetical protein
MRPTRHVGLLVLTAFGLAALACVAGHTGAFVLLGLATAVLGMAAVSAMRTQWAAAVAPERRPAATPSAAPAVDGDDLARELRRLHAVHVEKVNEALDEGREDLAQELSDSYADQALELITRR